MRRRAWAIIAVLTTALGVLIIATRDTGKPNDFSTSNQPTGVGTVVGTGGGWTLETYDDFDGCFVLRVNGAPTRCQSVMYSPGNGLTMEFSGEGRRFSVFAFGSEDPVTGRWFSSSHTAAPVTSYQVFPEVVAFVVELEPGEDPYGLQVVDGTGAVVAATSFVN